MARSDAGGRLTPRVIRTPPTNDHGMVTAETAVALPVLLTVAVALVWLVGVGVAQVRCVDAARDTARALARAETVAEARRLGHEVAPTGARLQISWTAEIVEVRVSYRATLPGGLFDDVVAMNLDATSRLPVEAVHE